MSGQPGNVDNASGLRVITAEQMRAQPLTAAPFQPVTHSQHLYLELAQHFEEQLQRGDLFPIGSKLPSIRKAAEDCQVAESTVVKAYQVLATKGFIQAQDRSGYIVIRKPLFDSNGTGHDPGTHDPLTQNPHAVQVAPIAATGPASVPQYTTDPGHETVPARPVQILPEQAPLNPALARPASLQVQTVMPPTSFAMTQPDPTQPAIMRRRIIVDPEGVPVEVRTSYLAASIAAGTPLADHNILPGRWETLIRDHTGRAAVAARTTTTARTAHAWEADALRIPLGAIVLSRDTVLYTKPDFSGPALSLTRSVYPADSTRAISTYPVSP